MLVNQRFHYVAKNFTTGLSDVTAKIRRNGVVVASGVSLSDIGNGRYELLLTPALLSGYGGAGWYDVEIDSASKAATGFGGRQISENSNDDIVTLINTVKGTVETINTKVDAIQSDVTSVKSTVEATNAEILTSPQSLTQIKAAIDAALTSVNNISNVTRFQAPVPKQLIRPNSGTKNYKVPVRVFDLNGNMEDPDSSQIQLQVKDESGNSRDNLIDGFTAQPHYIERDAAGEYYFILGVAHDSALEPLNFEFSYIENGKTAKPVTTSEIVIEAQTSGLALEATAQDILTDTADMQPKVISILGVLNDAATGLVQAHAKLDTINTNTNGVESELNHVDHGLSALSTKIDNLASQSSVNTLTSDVSSMKGAGYNDSTDSLKAISEKLNTQYSGGYIA